jgi:hypothetical protein
MQNPQKSGWDFEKISCRRNRLTPFNSKYMRQSYCLQFMRARHSSGGNPRLVDGAYLARHRQDRAADRLGRVDRLPPRLIDVSFA